MPSSGSHKSRCRGRKETDSICFIERCVSMSNSRMDSTVSSSNSSLTGFSIVGANISITAPRTLISPISPTSFSLLKPDSMSSSTKVSRGISSPTFAEHIHFRTSSGDNTGYMRADASMRMIPGLPERR